MANEKRLVDINEFPLLPMRLDGDMSEYERGYLDAQANMNMLPTVDAVEVVHGRWEDVYGGKYAKPRYMCSVCKEKSLYAYIRGFLGGWIKMQALTDYCPHCGAKMDGERKDNE